jgi:hypothetical protein
VTPELQNRSSRFTRSGFNRSPGGVMRGARHLARRPDARFVSGGIGETEQQQLIARESDFNLKLVFTAERPSGAGGG